MITNKLVCNQEVKIKDVMMCINENTKGIAFIIDDEQKLIGVMTDGDIRRLLINGYGLNDTIKKHIQRNFIYAFLNEEPEKIIARRRRTW